MALGGGSGGGSRAIEAGQAFVRLGAKDGISSVLKKVAGRFAEFGKMALQLTGVGGLIGGLLGGLSFKETVDDLAKMNDVAKAFGVSGTRISGLFGVLGAAGGEFKENLEGVIQFSGNVDKALNGVGQGVELFEGLAVSAKEIAALPIDDQFYRVLGAIRDLPQPMQEAKLALLGGSDSLKQWQRLLSMSNDEIRQMAKDLAFSSAELEDAAKASRAMERVGAAVKRIWEQIVIIVAPFVADIANKIADALKPVQEWLKGRTLGDLWDMVKAGFSAAVSWIDLQAKKLFVNVGSYFAEEFNKAVLVAKLALADLAEMLNKAITGALKGPADLLAAMLDKINPTAAMGLKAAMGAAGNYSATTDREAAKKEFTDNETLREKITEKLLKGLNADLVAVGVKLVAEFARLELNRKNRLADPDPPPRPALQQRMAQITRSLGTFGAGSFLGQAFGVQSAADVGKRMVGEQQKTNALLGDIKNKVGPLVATP